MSTDFKLFVPSGYGERLHVSGSLGARPDVELVGGESACRRSRLPGALSEMTFTFRRTSHPLPEYDRVEKIQNFYYYDDFFVVTKSLKDFFHDSTGGELAVLPVDVRHDDGTAAGEPYFAVKVTRTIDCMDLAASTARRSWLGSDLVPLETSMISFSLRPEVAAEFANVDGDKYVSLPPRGRVHSIKLVDSRIPSDAVLFQPTLWPGHLIAASSFLEALAERCLGGTQGYYAWGLDLDDVDGSHQKLMHALR